VSSGYRFYFQAEGLASVDLDPLLRVGFQLGEKVSQAASNSKSMCLIKADSKLFPSCRKTEAGSGHLKCLSCVHLKAFGLEFVSVHIPFYFENHSRRRLMKP